MTTRDDSSAEDLSDREIVSSRVFDAPPERLFEAWADPIQLAQWWGPHGFTDTFAEFDLKPGGRWRFIIHGPDGTDSKNHSIFVEVVRPVRIVYDHVSGPKFQFTANFEEQSVQTRLTFLMRFEATAACERAKTYAIEGNEQNFDRLAAHFGEDALRRPLM